MLIDVLALFASGESRSKLGPPDGVLDSVLVDGEGTGESFEGDGLGSEGPPARAFSLPVTASEVARSPPMRLEAGLTGRSQSDPRGRAGDKVLSKESSLVTVGEIASFGGGRGRGGPVMELSEGFRRRPLTDRP